MQQRVSRSSGLSDSHGQGSGHSAAIPGELHSWIRFPCFVHESRPSTPSLPAPAVVFQPAFFSHLPPSLRALLSRSCRLVAWVPTLCAGGFVLFGRFCHVVAPVLPGRGRVLGFRHVHLSPVHTQVDPGSGFVNWANQDQLTKPQPGRPSERRGHGRARVPVPTRASLSSRKRETVSTESGSGLA